MSIPKLAGIETEYAIVSDDPVNACQEIVGAYPDIELEANGAARRRKTSGANPCVRSFSNTDLMLPNGARFYVDHAHPEYSTPESADPAVVVAADRAGAEIAWCCAVEANKNRKEETPIRLYKNNSDHFGNTYGCHENYLMDAGTYGALFGDKAHWVYAYLVPFLVSRIVFTGAGKVGSENGAGPAEYQLSQRADFFEHVVGLQTTYERPIVNTRDEPHADANRFRRLHVIAGDANMCPYAGWLKVGTMQILLRMLEDGAMAGTLYLADPVAAIKQISHDPKCRRRIRLEDRRELSAIEIQMELLEHAQRYYSGQEPGEIEAQVLQEWEQTLLALREEPAQLMGKLDWVTKREVIGGLKQEGVWDWNSPQAHEADFNYHALDPDESIFHILEKHGVIASPPGWDSTLVQRYQHEAPSDSRAYLRGECIRRFASKITTADWEEIVFRDGRLSMPDPSALGETTVREILKIASTPKKLLKALHLTTSKGSGRKSRLTMMIEAKVKRRQVTVDLPAERNDSDEPRARTADNDPAES